MTRTLQELLSIIDELKQEVETLYRQAHTGIDPSLTAPMNVIKWGEEHNGYVRSNELGIAARGEWAPNTMRMAIHRLYTEGRLERIETGVYILRDPSRIYKRRPVRYKKH